MKRKIIDIDEKKCNGCGVCIPNCPEGALQIIEGKARLISDLFCDGLGACINQCPKGAIRIEEREALEYDERKALKNIIKQGKKVIEAHLMHLKEHNQEEYLKQALDFLKEKNIDIKFPQARLKSGCVSKGLACPGSKVMDFGNKQEDKCREVSVSGAEAKPQLRQWPIQLTLVPSNAPFLQNADLLIAADCVPFAYASFHQDLLKGRVLLVGCPKLDDLESYQDKLNQILKNNKIKSLTYVHMEVPCCFGLVNVIKTAIAKSGKDVEFKEVIISIKGEKIK